MNAELFDRFWSKVQRTDSCWLWQGAFNSKGYGNFKIHGKALTASRVAWELIKGPIPTGMQILHTCDKPACVNPDHLFLGTPRMNAQDRNRKERQAKGERNGRHKLTPMDVSFVRYLWATKNYTQVELGEIFHCDGSTIWKIVHGKRWN
jgi:hypothetical protein